MIKEELHKLIAEKQACIGVIGLGYVGLPLIVEFGLKGFRGTGFEVDTRKADEINAGIAPDGFQPLRTQWEQAKLPSGEPNTYPGAGGHAGVWGCFRGAAGRRTARND